MSKTSLVTHHRWKISSTGCSVFSRTINNSTGRTQASRRSRLPRLGMTVVRAVSAPESFTAWDTATQRIEKRTDIKTIMLLGAGPIVIGQVGLDLHVPRLGHCVGLMV